MYPIFDCRQEARDIIKNAANASDADAVIFTGHGCTDALQKLISSLDLRDPPIVFTGSNEHYDNLGLWQEIGAKVFYFKLFVSLWQDASYIIYLFAFEILS